MTHCLRVSRLLSVPAGPQLRIKTRGEARSDVPGLRPVPGCEPGPAGDGYRFTGYTTTLCLCLAEEVEIRLGWCSGHGWTGGKSVSRLPSEYMITVVISQTKSRLGARRSRDERTEKPDRASSFVTDITLPSSLIREKEGNQTDRTDTQHHLHTLFV